MTDPEIEHLWFQHKGDIVGFARAVEAAEREACAVVCEWTPSQFAENVRCAAAIRGRSNEG